MLVNIATRSIHSQLNKMLIERLPLALPPHTTNPSIYISGILHVVPIYHTFESLWQALLDSHRLSTGSRDDASLDFSETASSILEDTPHVSGNVSSRLFSLLSHLRLPGLLRAGRLRADIRSLTGVPEHLIDDQIAAVSSDGELARFIEYTTNSVETKPHVLAAYAWVLYMALFSGGRYIRASLQHAGGLASDFWARDASPVRPLAITVPPTSLPPANIPQPIRPLLSDITPRRPSRSKSRTGSSAGSILPFTGPHYLQFLEFIGEEDGEDLKREFKKRLAEAEMLLKEEEKEDIINEAVKIFEGMVALVKELDSVCGAGTASSKREEDEIDTETSANDVPNNGSTNGFLRPSRHRELRDSVVVTRERRVRKKLRPKSISQETVSEANELNRPEEEQRGRTKTRSNRSSQFTDRIGKLVRFNTEILRGEGRRGAGFGEGTSITARLVLILSGLGLWAFLGVLVLVYRMIS